MEAAGGIVDSLPQNDFQKWRAVVDLDGDTWSSRFGTLLCGNSVVFKVEPRYVDYFHYNLQPWKHYIPIRADFADLEEKVNRYVVSNTSLPVIREIVRNAQEWCQKHLLRRVHGEELLKSLTFYVEKLNKDDPLWQEVWKRRKATYFLEESPADMQEVPRRRTLQQARKGLKHMGRH